MYCINLTQFPGSTRIEGTVVGRSGGGSATVFARVTNGQAGTGAVCPAPNALRIYIVNSTGVATDGRFSFVVP